MLHRPAPNSSSSKRPRGVYAITPDDVDSAQLIGRVQDVLSAGVTWIQYRNKNADATLRREQAAAIKQICALAAVPLIVNDDIALAAAIDADGVHLGADDAALAHARSVLGPDAIIGVSCYDDLQRARHALAGGADYVAFGAMFASPTKPHARRAAQDLLRAELPGNVLRVAIGGITPINAGAVINAGADLVAVISGVFDAADPAAAVRAYNACFAASDA